MVSGPAAETARGQERNQGGLPGGRAVGGDAAVHRSATPAPREVGISSPPSARAPGPLEDPGGTRHTHRGPRLRGRRSPAGSAAPRAAAAGRTGTAREGPRGEARGRPGPGAANGTSGSGARPAAAAHAGTRQRRCAAAVRLGAEVQVQVQVRHLEVPQAGRRGHVAARARCGAAEPRSGPPLAMVSAERRARSAHCAEAPPAQAPPRRGATPRSPRTRGIRPPHGAELRSCAPEPGEPGTVLSCGAALRSPGSPRTGGIGPRPRSCSGRAPGNPGSATPHSPGPQPDHARPRGCREGRWRPAMCPCFIELFTF